MPRLKKSLILARLSETRLRQQVRQAAETWRRNAAGSGIGVSRTVLLNSVNKTWRCFYVPFPARCVCASVKPSASELSERPVSGRGHALVLSAAILGVIQISHVIDYGSGKIAVHLDVVHYNDVIYRELVETL